MRLMCFYLYIQNLTTWMIIQNLCNPMQFFLFHHAHLHDAVYFHREIHTIPTMLIAMFHIIYLSVG